MSLVPAAIRTTKTTRPAGADCTQSKMDVSLSPVALRRSVERFDLCLTVLLEPHDDDLPTGPVLRSIPCAGCPRRLPCRRSHRTTGGSRRRAAGCARSRGAESPVASRAEMMISAPSLLRRSELDAHVDRRRRERRERDEPLRRERRDRPGRLRESGGRRECEYRGAIRRASVFLISDRASAASRVLDISIARVMGPTPPGTGVIAAHCGATEAKSTSPTMPSSVRLMPTSMTTAPSLHVLARRSSSGRPIAATRMSASRHTAGRSTVRLWQ